MRLAERVARECSRRSTDETGERVGWCLGQLAQWEKPSHVHLHLESVLLYTSVYTTFTYHLCLHKAGGEKELPLPFQKPRAPHTSILLTHIILPARRKRPLKILPDTHLMDQTIKSSHVPLQLRSLVETQQNKHLSLIVNEIFSRLL